MDSNHKPMNNIEIQNNPLITSTWLVGQYIYDPKTTHKRITATDTLKLAQEKAIIELDFELATEIRNLIRKFAHRPPAQYTDGARP